MYSVKGIDKKIDGVSQGGGQNRSINIIETYDINDETSALIGFVC